MNDREGEKECGAGVPPATRKTRRCLPHWFLEGATYFVTFRLADSMPHAVLERSRREQEEWLRANPTPRSEAQEIEFRNQFNRKRQAWLDAGHGSCILRHPTVLRIVGESLHFFDATRYDLGDFVVMPNHVHLLVTPREGHELSQILHSWKSFSSKAINKQLRQTGTLWQDESYDHIVRSPAQLDHYRRYIAENPVKAKIRSGEYYLHIAPQPDQDLEH